MQSTLDVQHLTSARKWMIFDKNGAVVNDDDGQTEDLVYIKRIISSASHDTSILSAQPQMQSATMSVKIDNDGPFISPYLIIFGEGHRTERQAAKTLPKAARQRGLPKACSRLAHRQISPNGEDTLALKQCLIAENGFTQPCRPRRER